MPLGWAFWLCLTGQFIDAQKAYNIGIVQGVYPQASLRVFDLGGTEITTGGTLAAALRTSG